MFSKTFLDRLLVSLVEVLLLVVGLRIVAAMVVVTGPVLGSSIDIMAVYRLSFVIVGTMVVNVGYSLDGMEVFKRNLKVLMVVFVIVIFALIVVSRGLVMIGTLVVLLIIVIRLGKERLRVVV